MMSIKWLLFFSLIPAREGLQKLWESDDFSFVKRTVKTILESCYKDENLSNPILMFGDFDEFTDNSSIIRMNDSLDIKSNGSFHLKASKFILIEDSPEKLKSDLILLKETQWWDHMALFFIIAKKKEACRNFKEILNITWTMDIVNSIYVCAESMNTSVLYTLNSMANYAPHPWERMEELSDLNVFRQVFNENSTCRNLNYDKTRFLNGYEIKALWPSSSKKNFVPRRHDFEKYPLANNINTKLLRLMVTAINASVNFEVEIDHENAFENCIATTTDITHSCPLGAFQRLPLLFPHQNVPKIAVVRLKPEISTLQKIRKLWSTPVLIAAAIALTFLTLVLTITNRNFALAVLDLVRLLTYTSIRADNRNHSFRIYFTTMLIFMIISNGVFQSKIAAFLTKQERGEVVESIDEFADMGYKMFAVGNHGKRYNEICPKCNFKKASPRQCIENVLNNSLHLCVIWETEYYRQYSQLDLDYDHQFLSSDFSAFGCRRNWPLQNRFNDMVLRVLQTGVMDFWRIEQTSVQKQKREAREEEWSSAQYRPVQLYKLMFAFQTLAIGLVLSIIVFILELLEAKYGTTNLPE